MPEVANHTAPVHTKAPAAETNLTNEQDFVHPEPERDFDLYRMKIQPKLAVGAPDDPFEREAGGQLHGHGIGGSASGISEINSTVQVSYIYLNSKYVANITTDLAKTMKPACRVRAELLADLQFWASYQGARQGVMMLA